MSFTLLRAADRVATPWKNGGGITREVAAWPPGAGFDAFDWRVSLAEVRQDGPFSSFPGVDRILAVLEGRLRLAVAGRGEIVVSVETPPASFPGDAGATGRLDAGPVLDLNLMFRRGQVAGRLDRLDVRRPRVVGPLAPAVVLLAETDGLRVSDAAYSVDLDRHDAVLIRAAGGKLRVEAPSPAIAYVASFETA